MFSSGLFSNPECKFGAGSGQFLLWWRPGRIEGRRDLHTCDHIHMRPEHETWPSVRDHRGEREREREREREGEEIPE